MALLKTENSEKTADLEQIRELLAPLQIQLDAWPISKSPELQSLLEKTSLNDQEKEETLGHFAERFAEQQSQFGYKAQDLVVLHDEVPGIDELLAKFDRTHTHDDDEVRYIVDGSGFFGFVFQDDKQALLKVEAGEYIRVPANTEHWFLLDKDRRIKAIRYFTDPAGWVANYTDKEIKIEI